MISPSGPQYATVVSGGVDWTTQSNATGVENGTTADNFNQGPGGGGHSPSDFSTSGHGFAIPTGAVIDGIKLEAKVYGDTGSGDTNIRVGTSTKISVGLAPNFGQIWPNPAAFLTWGGATSLWGRTDWAASDINHSSFGAILNAMASHATGTISIDAVRITVYWHVGPAEVPKRYLYKVYNSAGQYIGVLPQPKSEFGYAQDINTSGVQIQVDVPGTADTSRQPTSVLTDEAGNILTDESSVTLTDEGGVPMVAPGDASNEALIKNGNRLQIWEYSYYWPNGKCMFRGHMEKWEAEYGGDTGDIISITAYSEGQDLDDYLIRGNPYTYTGDVTQATQAGSGTVDQAGIGASWDRVGQSWKVGSGVTNLGAISLLLFGTAHVTIKVYDTSALTTLMGSVTQFVSVGGATEIQFGFPATIVTVPLSSLFFTVEVDAGESIVFYYSAANPYADGSLYNSNYGGGGGGGYVQDPASDLYFKTFSGTGATIGTFTSQDPTVGMLETFMNDYISRGGLLTYNSATIDATALSLTYSFNTNTIYEGVGAVRAMALSGFYSHVDIGASLLYMKRVSTTADITLTRGRHIARLKLAATIEGVKNTVNFTGGDTGGGVNLYRQYDDADSVRRYRTRLDRRTDNRVTIGATADAIGGSALEEEKDEQYQSTVTILARTMDITLVRPGLTLGFRGYGTFVDTIIAQIVSIDYAPDRVICVLGVLPKRLGLEFDKTTRGLLAQQTIANPTSPS